MTLQENTMSLARELLIPGEIIREMPTVWKELDMAKLSPLMYSLSVHEESEAAYKKLAEIVGDSNPKGLKMLICQLCAALETREQYFLKDIPDSIFIETMLCYARFINEHMQMYGSYGFDRGWWTWRQLSMRLFRLGVLEFELRDDIISVHIPSDAVMTAEALRESYDRAKAFYAKQDITHNGIYCGTWLLSPVLKEILPPESRILNFQRDYEILELFPESKGFMRWVFAKEYGQGTCDLTLLPEETTLQRGIKKLLLAGKTVGDARGRYMY